MTSNHAAAHKALLTDITKDLDETIDEIGLHVGYLVEGAGECRSAGNPAGAEKLLECAARVESLVKFLEETRAQESTYRATKVVDLHAERMLRSMLPTKKP